MSTLDLQISASIIEHLARFNSRGSIRMLVNTVNTKFQEEKLPYRMTFSHETKKIRVKEIKQS